MIKVLVVEDDPAILRGLADNLRFEGYEVFTAQDGEAGARLQRAHTPDLIVLDLMMPRLGGLDLCRRLRGEGIAELESALDKHAQYLAASGELERRNRERVRIRIETLLKEKFMGRLIGGALPASDYEKILDDVLRKRNNPHDAAESVLTRVQF